jgi:shikimate dehydrogenase
MRPGQPRRVAGLIGYPVKHSISARFQQAGFDFLHLPITYELWETPSDKVADAVARCRQPDCVGMNVTVPHKQAVMPLLDELDPRAARIGAVNTVVNRDGRLTGHNTDAAGLIRALDDVGFIREGARVAIIGAGGVARAAAFSLAGEGVGDLLILARRRAQAAALAESIAPELPGRIDAGELVPNRPLHDRDLIVNCTSVGMLHGSGEGQSPLIQGQIGRDTLVYDLVYNPPVTPLLAAAKAAGARTLGGLPMLVYQGAAAFELWTGQKPPIGLMMARAEEALHP